MHGFPKWFRPDVGMTGRICLLAECYIISCFAGQIAEEKFLGRRPRYGMRADNQSAVEMAFRLHGSQETSEAYLRYCFSASRDLVNANWKGIEAVANALIERISLNQDEVRAVIWPGGAVLTGRLRANSAKEE
jgi:hypothetical protein